MRITPELSVTSSKNRKTDFLGHAGMWYNETADQFTGTAEAIDLFRMHQRDVRSRLLTDTSS